MELLGSVIGPSAERPGWLRLAGTVRYDDGRVPPEAYWFEVPERYGAFLSRSGNPWLACLLPLAVTLGEPLRISLPVDEALLENAQELMRIWRSWYPSLRPVQVDAPPLKDPAPQAGRTASFFSAGVDAFFTLLSHESHLASAVDPFVAVGRPIDDMLCVWGLDIPLTADSEFDRLANEASEVARVLRKECITVATNLTSTRLREAGWGMLYHGAALASIGLALEQRFAKLLIPSSYTYAQLAPWGSHPLTDPLLSTSQLTVRHDGAAFGRVAKTRFISQFELTRRSLRVCWDTGGFGNCGECVKCYRTMTTLYLLGRLQEFPTFPGERFDVRRVGAVWMRDHGEVVFSLELIDLAREVGRTDIARAIKLALDRSRRLTTIYDAARWLIRRPLAGAIIGRALRPLRSRIVRGVIYDDLPAGPQVAARNGAS